MGELKYCDQCKGTKKMLGMGMILHDCLICHGIGWVEDHIKDEEMKEQVIAIQKKKPGRKPKDK